MSRYRENRNFMKSKFDKRGKSDFDKGIGYPAVFKDYEGEIIKLPSVKEEIIKKDKIHSCIEDRKTNRVYNKNKKLSLDELSYILWASQGVKKHIDGKMAFRTVPSAGGRHPFESYLIVLNVDTLEKGIYRYLPLEHALVKEAKNENLEENLLEASLGQSFLLDAQVNLVWAAKPYRTEWKYDIASHKMILIDAGHIGQATYMACEALDLGTCGICAFNQEKLDQLVGLDGRDEFAVYMAPIGIKKGE